MIERTALEQAMLRTGRLSYLLLGRYNEILDCSQSMLDLLQLSKKEVVKKSVFEIFPTLLLEDKYFFEYHSINGNVYYFEISIFNQSTIEIYLIFTDITRKRIATTEQSPIDTHSFFKPIKEKSPDIVILKDRLGNWLDWNRKAEKLLPFDSSGNTVRYFSPVCSTSDKLAWESRSFLRVDEKLPDGQIYDVVKIPVFNSDNSPKHLLVIARNITERAYREENTNKLNVILEILRKIDKVIKHEITIEVIVTKSIEVLVESDLFCSTAAYINNLKTLQMFEAGLPFDWSSVVNEEASKKSDLSAELNGIIKSDLYYKGMIFGNIYAKSLEKETLFDNTNLADLLDEVASIVSYSINSIKLLEKQKQSENLLNAFFDNLPGIVFIRDSKSRYVKMNKFLLESFAEKEWIAKDPITLFGKFAGDALIARDKEVLLKKTIYREVHFLDKAGLDRIFDCFFFLIKTFNENPLIGCVGVEVTDKFNAANTLIKSEERYRTIFESAISSVAVLSSEGVIIEANKNVVKLTGYTMEEIIGKMPWTSFVHPDDLKMVAQQRKRRLSQPSDKHQEYEFRLIRKDKQIRNIRMRTGTIPLTDGVGIISLYDVTNTLSYQKQLKQALDKTNAILKAVPDLMFVLSRQGKFLDFHGTSKNKYFFNLYRAGKSTIFDIGLHEKTAEELQKLLALTLESGKVQHFSYSLVLEDGIHHYEASIAPFENECVLVLSRDVTLRKIAEKEKMEFQKQLRHVQKLESLGVLAGGIAHDFNNILMAISGNLQLALLVYEGGGDISKYLKSIDSATARASDLATQMLDYSGKADMKMLPIDINIIVTEMSDILSVTVSKKANINLNLDSNIPLILGDSSQIRQVFMNLITNASEALENKNGDIFVSTGIRYLEKDYIDSFSSLNKLFSGNYVFIEVRDNGCGISNEVLGKLFDPFFTTKFTGRGLGLSAVLGIMSNHSGALQFESEVGIGSTFRAFFPVSSDSSVFQPDPSELHEENNLLSGTILCVDDEPLVREILKAMLEQFGFSVIPAVDGVDCIRKFKQNIETIDLIILDITMPKMDGNEAFLKIKQINEEIPVLISSGYSESEIVAKFTEKYPDGFLQKPFSVDQLKRKIKFLLDL